MQGLLGQDSEGIFGKVYLVSNENNQLFAKKIYDPDIPKKHKSLKNIRSLLDIEALKLFSAISNVVGGIKVIEIMKTEITSDTPNSKFGSLNVYMKYIKGTDLESLLHDKNHKMGTAELNDIRDRYNLAVARIANWLRENGQNVDEKAYPYSMKYGDISNSGLKMLYADVQLEGFSGKIMLKPDNVLVGPNLELYIIDPY